MPGKSSRVSLQFNNYDFRHKKALEILKSQPRHMTEMVVDSVLHYVSCPEANAEMSREWVREILKEELAVILPDIRQSIADARKPSAAAEIREEDMADLGSVMGMFRRGDQS